MKYDECAICEGIFSYNEKIIEVKGIRYCEACYEELENECPVCDGSGFSVAGIGHPCAVCEGTGVK